MPDSNIDASQYRDDLTSTDQSGLIIFKHKNKKLRSFPIFDRKLPASQSYESGLNNKSLVDYNAITPKYVTSKFAHPISTRDSSFYKPESEEKLHRLEEGFKVDCVAVTFKRFPRRQNVYEPYDPLKDEHCQRYFQSPIVLDVLKKTMPTGVKRLDSFHEIKSRADDDEFDPVFKTVRSSGYNLLVPYPYARTNTTLSRRSTTITKGSINDGATNSIISSRESSKNTDYYNRSAASKGLSPESSIRLPPIKNGKGSKRNDKDSNKMR